MLRILAALTLLVAVFTASGEVSHACGCVDRVPKTQSELDTLKRRADNGSIQATGTLWFEFEGVQPNVALERYWRFRAIRAGNPHVTWRRASHWMAYVGDTSNRDHKRIFIAAAVALLEKGYPNRQMLDTVRYGGISQRSAYSAQLREARAARAVLRDGIQHWRRRAQQNDADAAFHVATYYSFIEPNNASRSLWIARASSLGDPHYSRRETTLSPREMR